jgi:hypothetical protein
MQPHPDADSPANLSIRYPLLEALLRERGLTLQTTYTTADAASIFQVSVRTIQKRMRDGRMRFPQYREALSPRGCLLSQSHLLPIITMIGDFSPTAQINVNVFTTGRSSSGPEMGALGVLQSGTHQRVKYAIRIRTAVFRTGPARTVT